MNDAGSCNIPPLRRALIPRLHKTIPQVRETTAPEDRAMAWGRRNFMGNPGAALIASVSRLRRQKKYPPTPWSAQRLYRPFVRSSLVMALSLGFTAGAVMLFLSALKISVGLTWVTHTQAHGVAQVFGWSGLFMMGVAFHVVPRFRNGPIDFPWPQRSILALILVGIVLRFTGQTVDSLSVSPGLLAASGVCLVLGVVLFALVIGRALLRGTAPHGPAEPWLGMGLIWAVVAASLHLDIVIRMGLNNSPVAPLFLDGAFIHAATLGFIGNFIFGVSLRAVPAFLGLRPARRGLGWLAFGCINGGLGLTVGGWLADMEPWLLAAGALLELIGFASLVASIGLLGRRVTPRNYNLGTYVRYEWFVRSAYIWLLVAGILQVLQAAGGVWETRIFPAELAKPTLHVLALGFVTMMIMGMGSRMIPLFEGSILPVHRLMDLAYVSLNVGVVLRLAFGVLPLGAEWPGLAASGMLGTLALALFAWVIWRALNAPAREAYRARAEEFGRQHMMAMPLVLGKSLRPPGGKPAD